MARKLIGVSDWMSNDDRSTRVQGSCGGDCREVRLSLENSRSNVGREGKGSSRVFSGNGCELCETVLRSREKDGLDCVRSKGVQGQYLSW